MVFELSLIGRHTATRVNLQINGSHTSYILYEVALLVFASCVQLTVFKENYTILYGGRVDFRNVILREIPFLKR